MSQEETYFNIGNVYSSTVNNAKTLYVAVSDTTLVTFKNKKFGEFTVKKRNYIQETISVRALCKTWKVSVSDLDKYMSNYFSPDEEAVERARRDKFARKEEQEEFILD